MKENEAELVAVKVQIKVVSTESENRIVQTSNNTQGVTEKLASQIVEHRS
jgi:hypothetical protein